MECEPSSFQQTLFYISTCVERVEVRRGATKKSRSRVLLVRNYGSLSENKV